jgi:hypothetical protein
MKLIGKNAHDKVEVYVGNQTRANHSDAAGATEKIPKLLLKDLPRDRPTSGTIHDFVKRVAKRHSWRRSQDGTCGQVEAAFGKIYTLFERELSQDPPFTHIIQATDEELLPVPPLTPPPPDQPSGDQLTNGGDSSDPSNDASEELSTDDAGLNDPPNEASEEASANVVGFVIPPPPPPATTFVVAGKRANVSELALGTMIVADPGGGKTFMLKHLVDSIVGQVGSITNIVVVDMKGDLAQMVYAAPGNDAPEYDGVFFEVMTFGSSVGTYATLSGFDQRIDELESYDLSPQNSSIRRDTARFASIAQSLAQDLLIDMIVKTKSGQERLGGAVSVPSAQQRTTAFGTLTAKDEEMIAERLSSCIFKVFRKCKKAGVPIPRSYEALLDEIKYATEDRCASGVVAEKIDVGHVITQEDLDKLSQELWVRAKDDCWSGLYAPESRGPDANGPDAIVPLSGERLLAAPPAGYNRRITIVDCALFGLPGVDDVRRRTIASTVITRLERQVAMRSDGSQDAPRAMLVIDEASFVMPQSASKATGPDVSAMVSVRNLLKLHRDKGMAVVLATQRPKDLHPEIRSVVTGLRFIGKFKGEHSEKKMVMDSIVKDDALRKDTRDALSGLGRNQFVVIIRQGVHVVRSKPLKRLHESSSSWAQADEFKLEDLMSEDASVAEVAAESHPLAPFTRNVRARFV